jgi:hypothetical protein
MSKSGRKPIPIDRSLPLKAQSDLAVQYLPSTFMQNPQPVAKEGDFIQALAAMESDQLLESQPSHLATPRSTALIADDALMLEQLPLSHL